MTTPDPPTPTHEERKRHIYEFSNGRGGDRNHVSATCFEAYSDELAAELLKAQQRIAELEATQVARFTESQRELMTAYESAKERIAELEREVAQQKSQAATNGVATHDAPNCRACGRRRFVKECSCQTDLEDSE